MEAKKIIAQSISIITLGVEDLERSIKFYEDLGWELSPQSDPKMCTFMLASNIVLGLVPYEFLANDALLPASAKKPYNGFSLALNGASSEEVDALFDLGLKAGATNHQEPQWKDWGGYDGYSGYFLDPDGYVWEIAYAPYLALTSDNRLLPEEK